MSENDFISMIFSFQQFENNGIHIFHKQFVNSL